jgi:hypothetical protein
MRIKTTTYSDFQQKPCQFCWHGLLHITIGSAKNTQDFESIADLSQRISPPNKCIYPIITPNNQHFINAIIISIRDHRAALDGLTRF